MTLAFAHSRSKLAARLVLLALADNAHDDGIAWPGHRLLAEKAMLSERTVSRAISELESLGEIEQRKAQLGKRRINVYRICITGLLDPDYTRVPLTLDSPFTGSHIDASSEGTTGHPDTARLDIHDTEAMAQPRTGQEPSEGTGPSANAEGAYGRPGTVNRKRVTDSEYDLACAVLAAFNEFAGSRYRSADWVGKIVSRIREHSQLGIQQHRAIIASAFADPWWRGDASPSVIYGNAGIFERTLLNARRTVESGTMTVEEMASYGTEWGPGTPHATLAAARAATVELDLADVMETDG